MTTKSSNPDQKATSQQRCDFCGETVSSVRRVALDGSYERLRTPHKVQYACPACSEKKEQERIGMKRK